MEEKTLCFKIEEHLAIEIKKRALDKGVPLKDLLKEIVIKELKKEVD